MILTDEQQTGCTRALAFLKGERQSEKVFFSIQGLAGTGKTTLLAKLASQVPNVTVIAPTGKAAAVLRAKSGLPVKTVHSAIYDFKGMVEDEDNFGRMRPTFADKIETGLARRAVLLDESSMVGEKLAMDLLETGAVVVACGDPGQLPPVRDRQFFDTADVMLEQIHRQALESPIIRQAHAVRAGQDYRSDGDGFVALHSSLDLDLKQFDIVICWRNQTRKNMNNRVRHIAKGITGPVLQKGEPVMCLRNDHRLGIFNGEVYTLAEERLPGRMISLEGDKHIPGAVVEGIDKDFDEAFKDDNKTPFALAYAATAHKYQGSEAPRVLVFDEMPATNSDRPRWLYTALTRAQQHVTVVRPKGW